MRLPLWLTLVLVTSVTSAVPQGYSGYTTSAVDGALSICAEAVLDGVQEGCLSSNGRTTYQGASRELGGRRKALAALWKCHGYITANGSATTPPLRVLVWDQYSQWLTPALKSFSSLYGVPLSVDVKSYNQLLPAMAVDSDMPPPSNGSRIRPPDNDGGLRPPTGDMSWNGTQPPRTRFNGTALDVAGPGSLPPGPAPDAASQYAVWLVASSLTQQAAEMRRLEDLSQLVDQAGPQLEWRGISQPYRLQLATYAGQAVAVPLDAGLLYLFVRRGAWEGVMGQQQVPRTWTELLRFAVDYNALAAGNRSSGTSAPLPDYPICIPRGTGCGQASYLQAVWSSIAQTRGSSQALHFDPATMEPQLDSPAARAAFRIAAQLLSAAAPPEPDDGCGHGSLAFARGRCVLALAGFVPQMRLLQRPDALETKRRLGPVRVAPLPGSELVWPYANATAKPAELALCSPETCPHATPEELAYTLSPGDEDGGITVDATSSQSTYLVNRAPQAPTALLAGGVNSRSPLLAKLLALEVLSFLASARQPGPGAAAQPLQHALPAREALWAADSLDVWAAAGYEREEMRAALPVLQESQTHANLAWGLRMAGQGMYNDMLASTLAAIQAGNVSVDPWVSPRHSAAAGVQSGPMPPVSLAEALAAGRAVLAASYPPQVFLGLYNSSREPWIRGSRPPRPPGPWRPPTGTQASNRRIRVLTAVLSSVLPVLLVCAVAAACWKARRSIAAVCAKCAGCAVCGGCQRSGSALRKMHVPAVGANVALCVTDIQDSTTLWECLPPEVIARAVDVHHRCVRRLALRHGGYESATEGDSFILAFDTVRAAVSFALELQSHLLAAPNWPAQLLDTEVCKPTSTHLPAGYPFSHADDAAAPHAHNPQQHHHLPERTLSPRVRQLVRQATSCKSELRSARSAGVLLDSLASLGGTRGVTGGGTASGAEGMPERPDSPLRLRAGRGRRARGLHLLLLGASPSKQAMRPPTHCRSLGDIMLSCSPRVGGNAAPAEPVPQAGVDGVPAAANRSGSVLGQHSGAGGIAHSAKAMGNAPRAPPLSTLQEQLSWPPGVRGGSCGGGLGALSPLGVRVSSLTPPAAAATAAGAAAAALLGEAEEAQAPAGSSAVLSALLDSAALLGATGIVPVYGDGPHGVAADGSDGGGPGSPGATSPLWEGTDCEAVSSACNAVVPADRRYTPSELPTAASGASESALDGAGRHQEGGTRTLLEQLHADAAVTADNAADRQHVVFRGLRVRVGIHAAVPSAAELQYNTAAARMVYGGPCVVACKTVADMAHGGQVFLSAAAHRVLAVECQGLGGKPPGAMVLQMGLLECTPRAPRVSSSAAPDTPHPAGVHGPSERTLTGNPSRLDSSDLLPAQSQPSSRLRGTTLGPSRHPSRVSPRTQSGKPPHRHDLQPNNYKHAMPTHEDIGLEGVFCATSPALSQRLALLPPPRFPAGRAVLQDVCAAPLGRVACAVVRVPAAAALLRWRAAVAAESLRLFAQTALGELRRVPGAYLVSLTAAEVRVAFPCPVLAVSWALQLRTALLAVDWPQELLLHEMGEEVDAYQGPGAEGSAALSQPPSEQGTPRPRWSALGGFARSSSRDAVGGGGGGSRRAHGSYCSAGGVGSMTAQGARGGSASARRSSATAAAWEALLQLRHSHQPQSQRATPSVVSEAQLSGDSDGAGEDTLEPLARTVASPPLRRHRHSIESYCPAPCPFASAPAPIHAPIVPRAPAVSRHALPGRPAAPGREASLEEEGSAALAELALHMQGLASPSPAQACAAAPPGGAPLRGALVKTRSATTGGIEPKWPAPRARMSMAASLDREIAPFGQPSVGLSASSNSPGFASSRYMPRRLGTGTGLAPPEAAAAAAAPGRSPGLTPLGGSDADLQSLGARSSAVAATHRLGTRRFTDAPVGRRSTGAGHAPGGKDAPGEGVQGPGGACSLTEGPEGAPPDCMDGAVAEDLEGPPVCRGAMPMPAPTAPMPCMPSPFMPSALRQARFSGRGRTVLRGLRVHIGVAAGQAGWTVGGKSHALAYTGRVVSRALRLATTAGSGQVLCDAATQRTIMLAQHNGATAAVAAAAAALREAPACPEGFEGTPAIAEEPAGSRPALALKILPMSSPAGRRLSVRPAEAMFLCELADPSVRRGRSRHDQEPAGQPGHAASCPPLAPSPLWAPHRAGAGTPRHCSPPVAGQGAGWQVSRAAASLQGIGSGGASSGTEAADAWPPPGRPCAGSGLHAAPSVRRAAFSCDGEPKPRCAAGGMGGMGCMSSAPERPHAPARRAASTALPLLPDAPGAFPHAHSSGFLLLGNGLSPHSAALGQAPPLAAAARLVAATMTAGFEPGSVDAAVAARGSNATAFSYNNTGVAGGSDCFAAFTSTTCSLAITSGSALASSSLLPGCQPRVSPMARIRSSIFDSQYMPYIVCERVDEEEEGHDASGDEGSPRGVRRERRGSVGRSRVGRPQGAEDCTGAGGEGGRPLQPHAEGGAAEAVCAASSLIPGVAASVHGEAAEEDGPVAPPGPAAVAVAAAAAAESRGPSLSAPIPILQARKRDARHGHRQHLASDPYGPDMYAPAPPAPARVGSLFSPCDFLDPGGPRPGAGAQGNSKGNGSYLDHGQARGEVTVVSINPSDDPGAYIRGPAGGAERVDAVAAGWPPVVVAKGATAEPGREQAAAATAQGWSGAAAAPAAWFGAGAPLGGRAAPAVSPARLLALGSIGRRERAGSGLGLGDSAGLAGRRGSSSGGRLDNPPTFASLAQLEAAHSEYSLRGGGSGSARTLAQVSLHGGAEL